MYLDDHLYHVYNRGAHKLEIFRSEFQYNLCLNLFEKYKLKYRIKICAYCLMPNHFHLLIKQDNGGSISRFLQTSFNAYVQAFNQIEGHSGTIFQGAAKSVQVESDEYACQLVAYIHHNPVAAGLVRNIDMWPSSDYKEWSGKVPFRFEGSDFLKIYFEGSKEYSEFIKMYQEEKILMKIDDYLLD